MRYILENCTMKHSVIFSFLVFLTVCLCPYSGVAQTQYAFRVYYDEIHSERGELYQYSERYLGTTDVITDTGTVFVLRDIRFVNSKRTGNKLNIKHSKNRDSCEVVLPPLSEEALMAGNTAKKAESVAKQIYRIREARLALVAGEAEHIPADGSSMQQALDELNKAEQRLTALFIGTRTVTPHSSVVWYAADTTAKALNVTMARFSKFAGPVDKDDLSGAPVRLMIEYEKEAVPTDKKQKKDAAQAMRIKNTQIKVAYEGKTFINIRNL